MVTGLTGQPVVLDVHDGDTVRLLLDCGVETGAFPWIRIAGVNCPELGTPGGAEATDFTRGLLLGAHAISVSVHGRSFARWVGQVFVDGADIAGLIITAGHGVRYPNLNVPSSS